MTAPIQSVGHIVSVIQDRLASRTSTVLGAPARTSAQPGGTATPNVDIESLIGLRIKSIARDDPKRGRKAFRVFLESIFLARLGENLMHDPKFYELVDSVQGAMEADADLGVQIQAAIAHLLSSESAGSA
jgi:hypothetical protein